MSIFKTKEPVVKIIVTDLERRVILNALNELREKRKEEKKSYDYIDIVERKVAMPLPFKDKKNEYAER